MRVLFDCRYTRTDHYDGISRFTAELVGRLAERCDTEMLISDERQLQLLPDLPWHRIPSPTAAGEPWVAKHVNPLRPDVVYTPLQTMGSRGRRYPLVSTVHDLIYYSQRTPPRDLPEPVRLVWRLYHLAWWPQRMLLNGADAIVTVSETTAELIARHRLTKRPVAVVPNAAVLPPRVERSAPAKTLLYMGSFMPYKDVATLARAMHALPDYRLHLLSRIRPQERLTLSRLAPAGSLQFHDGVSDEEYAALLDTATALLSASRDEGFGIPLVEAMGRGTPIVVSDIPIFREIGGDAALFFPVGDSGAVADAVRELEGEWDLRSELAREQAEHFDWEDSADRLYEVLERAATSRAVPVSS